MKKTFTTTHIVLLVNEDNNFVKFSDFKSVDDFKEFLKENHLTYDAGEGNFISTNDDDHTSYIYICEKAYYEEMGYIADWDHTGLSNYFYDHGDKALTWGEDCESVWFVCGNYDDTDDETLEKIFNDLKLIDNVEIEIEFSKDYEFGHEAKYYTPSTPDSPTASGDDEPEPKPKKRRVRRSYYQMLIDTLNDRGIKEVILDTPVNIEYVTVMEQTDYGITVNFKTVSAEKISLEPNRWDKLCPMINGAHDLPDLSKEEYYEIVNQIKKKK